MTMLFILLALVAISPFLIQVSIGIGLVLSRMRILSFLVATMLILAMRAISVVALLVVPERHEQLRAILTTARLIAKWPIKSIMEFLDEFRALEHLPTIRQGMRELGIGSLYEYYWRRDILPKRAPALISHWQRPIIFIPGVKAQSFYPENFYPWIKEGIHLIPRMKEEIESLMQNASAFLPYHNEFGLATHPFVKTDDSSVRKYNENDWNMLFFYRGGREISANHAACPITSQFLKSIPELEKTMVCFSALRPGVWVPAHYGLTNAIVRVHLPIIAPPNCSIRVGEDIREWRPNKPLLFDDSYEHEVWNKSDQTRVVLFINAFHPCFSKEEREALAGFFTDSFSRCPAVNAWRELAPKKLQAPTAQRPRPHQVA